MPTPAERHAQLCEEIAQHNYAYYVLDQPTVSDAEYDGLFNELRALEKQHPELVGPASPTQPSPSTPLFRPGHPCPISSLVIGSTR